MDLSTVRGTGVGGRITKQDIFDATHRAAGTARPWLRPPLPRCRRRGAGPRSRPCRGSGPGTCRPSACRSRRGGTRAGPRAPAAGSRTEKMTRLRKVIAERMVESLQVSAQLTTVVEADVTRIAALRAKHKGSFEAREGVKLSFMPFFAKAIIEALKAYPVVNASIDQTAGTVTYHDAIHLGIAVDTERGLLVPGRA